jgi:hypothetical protein
MFCVTLLVATCLALPTNNRSQVAKAVVKAELLGEKDVGDISGYYACSGKEGVGKTYSGVAVITKKNDAYIIQWIIGAGGAFYGVAIRQGDTFAASWAIPGDKGVVRGINLYRIESGPRLVGRWTAFPGDGSIRTETLTFLKRLGEESE